MKPLCSFLALLFFFTAPVFSQTCQQKHEQANALKSHSSDVQTMASNQRSDTVDILNYNITLNITDFTTNVIRGNTAVKFTPKMNGVNKLNLDLLELTLDSVKLGAASLTSSYNDTLLQLNLPMTYNIGDTATVIVYYHGTPQGDASGWGGFYFQSGYAYNLGVGFAALPHTYGRVWFPCFDNFVERSSYQFNITTNGGKIAQCNGYLAADTTDSSGDRHRTWILNEQIPSYLACVAVAAYTPVHQTYNGIAATIPIEIAAVASDTTAVKASFINLPLALSTFENHFGPFMWNKVGYSMVPFSSGAMEHATNIAYPKATATGSLTYQNLYAHELSHHWFGDLATCRTAEDMWLNEGWAHYCEFLFYEALNGYGSYLTAVRNNHEDNLHWNTNKEGIQVLSNIPQSITYGDHVYNRGADVAHTMRGYMGDSLFFYSVRTYLAGHHYTDVSSLDFQNALTAASGMDMTDFFNDWVNNPGWCHFSIDSVRSVPSGSNYSVTVYVKQKLTDAPSYFTNVPLEVTFKSANWTENVQPLVMSGPNASFMFTVPFDPVCTMINKGEKISHAVAPEFKTLKAPTTYTFGNAKMTIVVSSIVDSAFVRVAHNYTAPDPLWGIPYRLSTEHSWTVEGILPSTFKAKATITYDGRTMSFSGNQYLDNGLINTYEDSLVLMYRPNAGTPWSVYPYYSKNMLTSNNDKYGLITIDTLKLGEYAYAMRDYTAGIQQHVAKNNDFKVFPNPAKDKLTIDLSAMKASEPQQMLICDVSGKVVSSESITQPVISLNTSSFANGLYFVSVKMKDGSVVKNKFIIAR
ncbi:MAG: M1 family aminopeptidase [Bacteroidia bacterium]